MSLKFDKARQEMVNANRKKNNLPVYETNTDRPRNAGRYAGSGLSDVEIAKLQNDDDWLKRNAPQAIENEKQEQETIVETEEQETEAADNSANLVDTQRASIVSGMQTFSNVLAKLNDKFCMGRAIYTMYFKMDLPNIGTLVDTTSPDWYENNLVSFTQKLNGSGEANTFTLDILFKPDDRNFKSINTLEAKLLSACAIYEDEQNLKEEDKLYCNCTFQYGYGDDTSLRSPVYYGTIMDYDSKLENGNLRYTIVGYCGLYSAREYRISAKSDYLTDANGNTINDPLSYIRRIFEVEFGTNNFYDVKFINLKLDDVKFPGEEYKQFSQKNIFQVVKDILAGCMTTAQYNASMGLPDTEVQGPQQTKTFLPNQKQIFSYFIDNKSSEGGGKYGTVFIYKMESLYGEENADKTVESISADCNIDFGWFAPTAGSFNHVVKEWHPQYEGSVLIALATTFKRGKDTYYTMTDDGDIKEVTGLGAARLGVDGTDENRNILSTIQEYNNWAFVTQYPYKATMTIMGAPCEVPMTGKIKVSARMGNQLHHSSGVYMVLGKTDKISSAGFFTELELFKFAPGFNPDYTVIKPEDDESNDIVEETEKEVNEKPYYQTLPNYSRDATINDVNSNFGKSQYQNWFVGKDGKFYTKQGIW